MLSPQGLLRKRGPTPQKRRTARREAPRGRKPRATTDWLRPLARRPPPFLQGRDTKTKLGRIRAARTMELAHMDKQEWLRLRQRIHQAQHKMVDVAERIIDTLAKPEPAPARAAERRQIANILHTWEFCARRGCRRTHACMGEPLDCLRICLPLLNGTAIAEVMKRYSRSRSARTPQGLDRSVPPGLA